MLSSVMSETTANPKANWVGFGTSGGIFAVIDVFRN